MPGKTTLPKLIAALFAVTIALWGQAGLALVQGDQVMQCFMTMQQMQAMGSMTWCPDDETRVPVLSDERPPCCSVGQLPERPLGFAVNSARVTNQLPDVVVNQFAIMAER